MAFVIADLLKDWPCTWLRGSFTKNINGVKDDSREIQAGDVFVVIKGKNANGATFIHDAIQKGAVCVIAEDREYEQLCNEVAFGIVPNTRTFLSHACSRIHGNPSAELHVVAITGTNGKTTVSHLIGQILTSLGYRTAVIGTLGLFVNGNKVEGDFPTLTTWSASQLHQTLAWLLDLNISHVILEASSMGLAQHRLDHCTIQQGVFLNIGHDHLEDHAGFEAYKKAKCKLIHLAQQLVVNEDDIFWKEIGEKSGKQIEWFGKAYVRLENMKPGSMDLLIKDESSEVLTEVGFTGDYNSWNISAAIAAVKQMNIPMFKIIPTLKHLHLPAGRFQYLVHKPYQVIIDYAHTPEALEHLLASASRIAQGRLLVVFGCGGDRDQSKRSEMGIIASRYAEQMWVTSDNPRSEDPLAICLQIVEHVHDTGNIHIETDRAVAIERALRSCLPGDLLCIAGKGHESTQHIGAEIVPFSDEETVLKISSNILNSWNDEK